MAEQKHTPTKMQRAAKAVTSQIQLAVGDDEIIDQSSYLVWFDGSALVSIQTACDAHDDLVAILKRTKKALECARDIDGFSIVSWFITEGHSIDRVLDKAAEEI